MPRNRWSVVSVVVSAAFVAVCLTQAGVKPVQAASYGPGPGQVYGPCCPLAQGHRQMHYRTRPSAARQAVRPGPRYHCGAPVMKTVEYYGQTYQITTVEAAGRLLVPIRTLDIFGTTVKWLGNRQASLAHGSTTLTLTVGLHTVQADQGGDRRELSWDLCPRFRGQVVYVPLREAAGALGYTVGWENGALKLTEGEPVAGPMAPLPPVAPAASTTTPAAATASPMTPPPGADACPASLVETALGVTVFRGLADSPFGQGVGVLTVTAGGKGDQMGLKAKDVILSCDGTRVTCPMGLEEIIRGKRAGATCACALVVAREGKQITLPVQPPAP